MSATIKISKTVRRQLPNGWFVWVGPKGISFRRKRQRKVFSLPWKEAMERAMLLDYELVQRALDQAYHNSQLAPASVQEPMFPAAEAGKEGQETGGTLQEDGAENNS